MFIYNTVVLGDSLYRTDPRGLPGQKMLSVPGGKPFWIRWSPGGEHLRFTVLDSRTEATTLWEADRDGANLHRILDNYWEGSTHQCCGTWSPDGKWFLFQVRSQNTYHVWGRQEVSNIFRKSSEKPVPLTSGPINYRGPVFSKDGTKLFVRTEVPRGDLVKFDEKSANYIPILVGLSPRTAAFSKDGNWIAYGSLTDNNLWRCRAGGRDCRQLTSGFQQVAMPRWSPDLGRIAFMGRYPGASWGVFITGASGEGLQQLAPNTLGEGDPDWSPDGTRLVFGNVAEPSERMAIRILDLRTRQVTIVPGSAGFFSPRWSPDGAFLAAVSADSQRLFIFKFETQQWKQVSETSAGYPSWSHDGIRLYFYSEDKGNRSVYRTNILTEKTERVAGLESVRQGPFLFGTWVGLAPDDSPLAVRNQTTEDIYAWDFEAR